MKALKQHPEARTDVGARRGDAQGQRRMPQMGALASQPTEIEQFLSQYPEIDTALDDGAFRALQAADPNRAMDIIEDVAAKGNVANVSAFVTKALRHSGHKRPRMAY